MDAPENPSAPAASGACLIFGGTGYIGLRLANYLVQSKVFERVVLADIQPPPEPLQDGLEFLYCDVRKDLSEQLPELRADWVINLAAVHREPGHEAREYFDTNIAGARNICAFAERINCVNQVFFSSISVYGPTPMPVDELAPTHPNTAYGMSKLAAELIYEAWLSGQPQRRLAVVRPGVIYGPGDPGNVLRMIRAVRRGRFVLPMGKDVYKSYGYIFGLAESVAFALAGSERFLLYNYVEKHTHKVSELVADIKSFLGTRYPTVRLPVSMLVAIAKALQLLTLGVTDIHPDRVRKVARSTHIVPRTLIERGFPFRYDFRSSLEHWRALAPRDFER